jgi:ionotropic kainate glutamate receptor 2
MEGLSGMIRLDAHGFRRDMTLDILELGKKGLEKVGRWEKTRGANYTRLWKDREAEYKEELRDKNLVVTFPIVSEMPSAFSVNPM